LSQLEILAARKQPLLSCNHILTYLRLQNIKHNGTQDISQSQSGGA
jgi:hypothetical protein